MANKDDNIVIKIKVFIERNLEKVSAQNFRKKDAQFDRYRFKEYEVVTHVFEAYNDVLKEHPDYIIYEGTENAILQEQDKILLKALYKVREYEYNLYTPIGVRVLGSKDPGWDFVLEFLEKLNPYKLEHGNEDIPPPDEDLMNDIIDSFFDLPYFEQEAFKLHVQYQTVINDIEKLEEELQLKKEEKPKKKTKKNSGLDSTDNKIKDIRLQILKEKGKLMNFEGSELVKSFTPEGILQLQKRAYIRLYASWEVRIKPKVLQYLETNKDRWFVTS